MGKCVCPESFVQTLQIDDILRFLPHRYPFLLVDKLFVVQKGIEGVGVKNVTMNEPFFQGHFPQYPVMPGVLQIETMAQTAGLIVLSALDDACDMETIFLSVERAKFRRPVRPGDTLKAYVVKKAEHHTVYRFSGTVFVNDSVVSESEFTAVLQKRNI